MSKQLSIIFSIVVLVLSAYFSFHLFSSKNGVPIKLGLDLRYGIHIMLEVYDPSKKLLSESEMKQIMNIMERRLNPTGTYEINIQESGNNRIIVEIPEVTDTSVALERVTKIGKLEFKVDEYDPNSGLTVKKTVLTGDKIVRAVVEYDPNTKYPHVAFTLNQEGAKIFEQVTRDYLNKPIYIYFDGKEISAPIVQSVITGGSGIITMGGRGQEDALKEARELAIYLNSGKLDYPPKVLEAYVIGPSLGQKHLSKSLEAGLLAIAVIAIFMIFFYRVPGVVAVLALVFYALSFLWIVSVSGTVLTLGSVAGIILSIGMAVDANILIFERLKEEIRSNKPLNTSLDLAFARSFDTILDSHLTTIIAAFILVIFGTSTIQGFGFALLWGNVVSFFTAIYVTKTILYLIFYYNPKLVRIS
jgi:preprotein translocase subunit SecD